MAGDFRIPRHPPARTVVKLKKKASVVLGAALIGVMVATLLRVTGIVENSQFLAVVCFASIGIGAGLASDGNKRS